jgi:hypothetical protein
MLVERGIQNLLALFPKGTYVVRPRERSLGKRGMDETRSAEDV